MPKGIRDANAGAKRKSRRRRDWNSRIDNSINRDALTFILRRSALSDDRGQMSENRGYSIHPNLTTFYDGGRSEI